jgi:hypothetical protein
MQHQSGYVDVDLEIQLGHSIFFCVAVSHTLTALDCGSWGETVGDWDD